MTGKQTAVLWMGILLIAAQFFFGGQFHILFGQIKSTGSGSPSKKNAGGGKSPPLTAPPPVTGP